MDTFELFTDGSCLSHANEDTGGGPGGWAACFRVMHSDADFYWLSGSHPQTNSTRMELTAAINGLKHLPDDSLVILFSDALSIRWVLDSVDHGNGSGGHLLFKRGANASKRRPPDIDLWRELVRQHDRMGGLYFKYLTRTARQVGYLAKQHKEVHTVAQGQARRFNRLDAIRKQREKQQDWVLTLDGKIVRRNSRQPLSSIGSRLAAS